MDHGFFLTKDQQPSTGGPRSPLLSIWCCCMASTKSDSMKWEGKRTHVRMHSQVGHHYECAVLQDHLVYLTRCNPSTRAMHLTTSSISQGVKVALCGINFPHPAPRCLLLEFPMLSWSIPWDGIRDPLGPEGRVICGWLNTQHCQLAPRIETGQEKSNVFHGGTANEKLLK